MTFAITPTSGFPPPEADEFPSLTFQFQAAGVDLGDTDADTLNFGTGLAATRGTGETANVVTVTAPDTNLRGSATFNPTNLVDAAGETTTVTVTGAALGDFALASFSLDLQGITVTAWVSAANTVSVRFQNESGGALNLASGTLRALVIPQ